MKSVEQLMKDEGFALMETGGGCTAYERVAYVLITKIDGCDVPESVNDKVMVGLYDAETDETICVQMYDSIVDFLKK